MAVGRVGTSFRAPFSVILADKSEVVIVNENGEVQGAVTPTEFTDDTTFDTDKKLQFRDTGIYIQSGSDGKLTISADGGGADDITLSGGVTVDGDLAVTGAVSFAAAVTFSTTDKLQFRDTGIFIQSGADGKITISADGSGSDDITLSGTVTGDDDWLLGTTKKMQFRDTGLFIQSSADGKLLISADGGGADDITLSGGVTLSNAVTASVGVQCAAVARTATSDGTGTGVIANGSSNVEVTSASASNIITLPAPTPGFLLHIRVGANGCKLQTSSPATVALNGGTGSGVKSSIAADTLVVAYCKTSVKWTAFQVADDGTVSAVDAAA